MGYVWSVGKRWDTSEKLYENNSRVTVLNCAISDESSKILEFFYVSDDAKILGEGLPAWYNQLGSFDKNNIIKHFDGLLEPYIISESVKIRTLDSLAEEYGSFQFLHIDAEGHDYQVLSSLNLDKFQPKIILMEYKHLANEQLQAMIKKFIKYQYKYRFFSDDVVAYK